MRRLQLICLFLLAGVLAAGVALEAPLWMISIAVICVIALQIALEIRHFRQTGEVCGSGLGDKKDIPSSGGSVQ